MILAMHRYYSSRDEIKRPVSNSKTDEGDAVSVELVQGVSDNPNTEDIHFKMS